MEHLNTRSPFSRPHTLPLRGRHPHPHPPARAGLFPTLRAWINTSAPACCADFSQPQQMVFALQRARAATPGTQGKSFRALATLSGSTCAHYKHRCDSMCVGTRTLKHASVRQETTSAALLLPLLLRKPLPAAAAGLRRRAPQPEHGARRLTCGSFSPAHKQSAATSEQLCSDPL